MYLGNKGIIPPKEWIHDPNIKDKYNNTVRYYLNLEQLPIPNLLYDEFM